MRLSAMYVWAVCTLVLAELGALLATILGWVNFGRYDGQAVATGVLLLGFALFGLACAAVRDRGRAPRWMVVAMAIAALAILLWNFWIWDVDAPNHIDFAVAAAWPSAIALSILLIELLHLPKGESRTSWWRALRFAAAMLIVALGVEICSALTFVGESYFEYSFIFEQFLFNAMMPLILLTSLAFATTMMTAWLPMSFVPSNGAKAGLPYMLVCPRCATEQQARTGEHFCNACGLRAMVECA